MEKRFSHKHWFDIFESKRDEDSKSKSVSARRFRNSLNVHIHPWSGSNVKCISFSWNKSYHRWWTIHCCFPGNVFNISIVHWHMEICLQVNLKKPSQLKVQTIHRQCWHTLSYPTLMNVSRDRRAVNQQLGPTVRNHWAPSQRREN